jgi:hypothetical protein
MTKTIQREIQSVEPSGFDVSQPWGDQAFRGPEFGWVKMLKQLAAVDAGLAPSRN